VVSNAGENLQTADQVRRVSWQMGINSTGSTRYW